MRINSNKIRLLIAEQGLNLQEFSNTIGISRSWLSQSLSRGKASPNLIVKIARGLEIQSEKILETEV